MLESFVEMDSIAERGYTPTTTEVSPASEFYLCICQSNLIFRSPPVIYTISFITAVWCSCMVFNCQVVLEIPRAVGTRVRVILFFWIDDTCQFKPYKFNVCIVGGERHHKTRRKICHPDLKYCQFGHICGKSICLPEEWLLGYYCVHLRLFARLAFWFYSLVHGNVNAQSEPLSVSDRQEADATVGK